MAERLGEAILELTTRDRGLKRGVADAERQARQLDRSFAKVGKNLQNLGSTMQQAGATMTRSISLPIALIGGASVKAFASFDAAMTQSVAIMGDVSDALRDDMVDAARDMAKETSFSATQAAESYFFLASAGLDAEASIAALPQVAQFAQAGMFDMATATDLLTDAQSALGLTIRDDAVANMENMARVSDTLVRANTLANATVEQFSQSLTREAGAALKSFNIDVEEGVAVLAAFADQGVKGEIAGTGLSRILRLMTTAAVDNAEAYDRLNVRVFDTFGNIRNLADIIADLEGALGGLTDAQRVAELSALGFQARVQGVILPLLGTSEAIRTYERELRSAAGFTQDVADKQLQTFSEQMKLVKDELVDVGIELGGTLAPIILDFARNKLIPAIESTRGLVEAFGDLSPQTQKAITGFAGFALILGPLLITMGSLVRLVGFAATGIATLTTRMAALRVASATAAGPLGLLAATLLALNEAISIFTAQAQRAEQAAIGQTNVLGQMNRAARDAQLAINQLGTLNVQQAEAVRRAWLAGMEQLQGFGREILKIEREIEAGVGRDREIVLTARLEELRKKADLTRGQIERLRKVIDAAPEAFAKAGVSAEEFEEALGGGDGGGGDGVSPAAKAVADEIQGIIDQATPLEAAFESLTGQADKLNKAIGEGSVRDLQRAQRAYENLQEQIGKLLVEMGDVVIEGPKVIKAITPPPEVHLNWERIAAQLPKATVAMEDVSRTVPDISDSLALVADNAARVFEAIGEERWAETARAISGVISAVVALSDAFSALSQTGGGGQGGGRGQQGQQGAQLAAALSFVNAWFAVIAAAFVLFEAFARKSRDFTEQFEITSQGLRDASESLSFAGGFEFGGEGPGGRVDFSGVKAEFQRFIDSFNQTLQEVMGTIGLVVDDSLAAFEFSLKTKVDKKTGQITDVYVRLADETGNIISHHFETIAQAEQFILQRFLQQAVEAGAQIDQAVREVITGFAGDPEQFQAAVNRVQQLADQAALALGEVGSALELEMRRLPAQLQALRIELTNLGLSAAQVERLVGGQLVASMQAWRQQITGEELSLETRRAIQKANAQLFNAERELRIAGLKARRAELEAQIGLTRAELELIRQGTLGYAEALKAKGAVYNAEIKLIIDQIEAINKIIEALVQIPEINIGRLRLPGVPRISTPRAPSLPAPGGGGGPSGPSLADQLAGLLDRLFPQAARMREYRENLRLLQRAFAEGLIRARRYKDAVKALGEQFTEGLRNALRQIDEFGRSLVFRQDSPVSAGRQLLLAQRELARQGRLARQTGDVSGFTAAASRLLDIGRQIFGSTAGFQGIFRAVQEQQHLLERDIGVQLENALPPAEQTSMSTKEIAETSEKIRENTELTKRAVDKVAQETALTNERNQVGHGRTQTAIRETDQMMKRRVEEQTRAFVKAIERIRVA